MRNPFKAAWDYITGQGNEMREKRDRAFLEEYNEAALQKITAVPSEDGSGMYVVTFGGYVVSEDLKAEDAMHLVDVIRRKYIEKQAGKERKIWY